jgi:FkbM family methyltransferase
MFVGPSAMEDGSFEPNETALFRELLAEADVVVNVGANVGYYCCIALGAGKKVIAFEPIADNVQLLLRNVRENGWQERLEVFPIALADSPNILSMFGSGTGASLIQGWANMPTEHVCHVPVSTLDLVLAERLIGASCIIVVDIEGGEWSFLRGATKVLSLDPKPIWMLEICVSEHQPKGVSINPKLLETFEIFWSFGFLAVTVDKNRRLVQKAEVEEIMRSGVDTLKVHSFLFVDSRALPRFINTGL